LQKNKRKSQTWYCEGRIIEDNLGLYKFAEVSKEHSYATFTEAEGDNRFFQKLINFHQTVRSHIQKDIVLEG